MVTLPAIAQSGLKLRADWLNTRLPCRSPLPAPDQAEVGADRLLEHVRPRLAVDLEVLGLLGRGGERDVAVRVVAPRQAALGDLGADAGDREERRDADAAGAQPLGERALRGQLDLELAVQVLALELLVLPDVRGDHPADPLVLEQDPEAPVVDAAVVARRLEVGDARVVDRRMSTLGMPQRPNPPTASDMPSLMPAMASAGVETTLSMAADSIRRPRARGRGVPHIGRHAAVGRPRDAAHMPGSPQRRRMPLGSAPLDLT